MPQKDLLMPWRTVLKNTTLGLEIAGLSRRAARKRALEDFPRFGLTGFEDAWPTSLSGGWYAMCGRRSAEPPRARGELGFS